MVSSRLLNVALQGKTLVARFILIFFLAKHLDAASLGYYGLFVAAVGYSLYFVGLDFYVYVTREVIKTTTEHRGQLVKGHVALSAVMYVAFIPFAAVFLYNSGWPEELIWWFFPIVALDYFNQEISRFLVAMSEQAAASLILFVRQGSLALLIVTLMVMDISNRNLYAVVVIWALTGAVAAALGIRKV